MSAVYLPSDREPGEWQAPMDAERLLRSLGATGRLVGFRYALYMLENVRDDPERIQLITKRLYPETARCFNVSPSSVERNLRTVVHTCWKQPDHRLLNHVAGTTLCRQPTNAEFIDMLAGFLRRIG